MDNSQVKNFYSQYSDQELIQIYNQIVADKSRIEWAYYYICMEMEERKKRMVEPNQTDGLQIPPSGGFAGASQFQKRVDEEIKKILKPEE